MWEERNVKTDVRPIFELCSNPDPNEVIYFLFPEEFNFHFYNAFCQNLGGRIPDMSTSQEGFHELMDNLENIVVPDIHEKCLHASGALMIWVGATDEYEVGCKNICKWEKYLLALTYCRSPGRGVGGLDHQGAAAVGRAVDDSSAQRRHLRQLRQNLPRQGVE